MNETPRVLEVPLQVVRVVWKKKKYKINMGVILIMQW